LFNVEAVVGVYWHVVEDVFNFGQQAHYVIDDRWFDDGFTE